MTTLDAILQAIINTLQGDDWLPPCPDPPSDSPSQNPMNILLEDVEKELLVLLDLQSYGEKYISNNEHIPASKEFERVLGSQGCKEQYTLVLYAY